MSKRTPRRQFLAATASSLAATIWSSCARSQDIGPDCGPAAADLDAQDFIYQVKRMEERFYRDAVNGSVGAGPATFNDVVVARYAREIWADKAGHLSRLAASPSRSFARLDLSLRPFTRIARMAGLIAPGKVFDPYADDDNFLLAAHMLETACAGVYRAARSKTREENGALAPLLADANYHAGLIRTAIAAREDRPAGALAADRISATFSRLAGGTPAEDRSVQQAAQVLLLGEGRRGGFFPEGFAGRRSIVA